MINYQEEKDFVIFKLSPRFRYDKNMENSFIKMLQMKNSIDSENDVVFTQTGMGIIRKSKSPNASKNPIFEEK